MPIAGKALAAIRRLHDYISGIAILIPIVPDPSLSGLEKSDQRNDQR